MITTPHIIIPKKRERAGIIGRVSIALYHYPTDRWAWHVPPHSPNLITDAGLNAARDALNGTGFDLDYLAVGTDGTAAAAGDTALGSEVLRTAFTSESTNAKQKVYRLTLGSNQANGNDLKEAGLFDQSSGGTLFARFTYNAVTKTQDVAVQYNWTVDWTYVP